MSNSETRVLQINNVPKGASVTVDLRVTHPLYLPFVQEKVDVSGETHLVVIQVLNTDSRLVSKLHQLQSLLTDGDRPEALALLTSLIDHAESYYQCHRYPTSREW